MIKQHIISLSALFFIAVCALVFAQFPAMRGVPIAAAEVSQTSLSTNTSLYFGGDFIQVSWDNTNTMQSDDWIGIATAGGGWIGGQEQVTWFYVNGAHAGTWTFYAPNISGSYQILYRSSNGVTGSDLARSASFTITKRQPSLAKATEEKSFFWQVQIPNNHPHVWLSDSPNAEQEIVFPTNMPRTFSITGILLRREGGIQEAGGQMSASIDKQGVPYTAGIPSYRLGTLTTGQLENEYDWHLGPYLTVDRDAGDKVRYQIDTTEGGIYTVLLYYTGDDSPASGEKRIFDWRPGLPGNGSTIETDGTGWNGYTLLVTIDPAVLGYANVSPRTLRATLEAGQSGGWAPSKAYIGARVAGTIHASSMLPLTFGGVSGTSIAPKARAVSDSLDVSGFDMSHGIIVKIFTPSLAAGTLRGLYTQPGTQVWWKQGDDAMNPTSTGYNTYGPSGSFTIDGLRRIEAFF
ncbi:MAG: hypothetical protein Q8R25_02555 [bacterium]|nr:hypothetical protein [bacterium]